MALVVVTSGRESPRACYSLGGLPAPCRARVFSPLVLSERTVLLPSIFSCSIHHPSLHVAAGACLRDACGGRLPPGPPCRRPAAGARVARGRRGAFQGSPAALYCERGVRRVAVGPRVMPSRLGAMACPCPWGIAAVGAHRQRHPRPAALARRRYLHSAATAHRRHALYKPGKHVLCNGWARAARRPRRLDSSGRHCAHDRLWRSRLDRHL